MKRTKFPPTNQRPEVPLNLIRSIAWAFSKTSKISWDELFSEACLAYCKSLASYNPTKGASPTTWAHIWIKSELINFCKKETRTQSIPNIDWLDVVEDTPSYEFFKNHEDLSEDCRFIVEMVLASPQRYAKSPRKAMSLVKQDLKVEGWGWRRIFQGVADLQKELLDPKPKRGAFLFQ